MRARFPTFGAAALAIAAALSAGCGDAEEKREPTPGGPIPDRTPPPEEPAGKPFTGVSPAQAWDDFAKARAALVEAAGASGDDETQVVRGIEAEAKAARPGWKARTAQDVLALARFSDAFGEPDERAKRLEEASKDDGEAGRVATTWLLTLALEDHDPAAALARLERIVKVLGGKGTDPHGRAVTASILAGAIADEAAATARRRVEGVAPDAEAARKALVVGTTALALAGSGDEDRAPLERAAAYVALGDGPRRLDLWAPLVSTGDAPRIVVFADHFQLGEPILPSVLKRWRKGLPVTVVGILSGRIRQGIRRVPAEPAEERKALETRVHELGLLIVGGMNPTSKEASELGIDPAAATVLVLDAGGRILARAAGNSLDPRVLDPVVTRLAPTAAFESEPGVPPK